MSDNEESAARETPQEPTETQDEQIEEADTEQQQQEESEPTQQDEPVEAKQDEPVEAKQDEPVEAKQEEQPVAEASQEDQPVAEEGKQEEQPTEPQEEAVIITPDDSPFWLSTDEVLSRGLPESEVENFKNFYFRQTHSLQAWYEKLKEVAVPTEFITLSKEEIDALSLEGEASEEQATILSALEDRVNQVIELFAGNGAIVRVNGRSAKDAILDRDEETFIAEVRDAVVNELEVEKQRANAYAIWKEQEKQPSAFKRGINSIRASLRRSRVNSAGRRTRIQEEKPGDESSKPQDKSEEAPATEGEAPEAPPAEERVEVEVETTEEPASEAQEETDSAPPEQQPVDQSSSQPVQDEPQIEPAGEAPTEQAPTKDNEDTSKDDEGTSKDGEGTSKDGEGSKDEAGSKDEGAGKPEEASKDTEPEIQPVEEEKPKSASPAHHKLRKGKTESLDNQIVRAFIKSTTARHRVSSGKEGIALLRRSNKIRTDLNTLKAFGGIEGIQVSLSVCQWQEEMASYPGMEFRAFVYQNELTAVSQYNDAAYYPNNDVYYNTIQAKVEQFFKSHVQEPLRELDNYIIDFYVTPNKIIVVRLNPFYTGIGACLFTWNRDGKQLTQGPFQLRIIESPLSAPEAFTSFQPFWTSMLDSVLQQRRPQRQTRTCSIL